MEEENKNKKNNKLVYIFGGIAIGLLLASTITMSVLYATKEPAKEPTVYSVFYSCQGQNVAEIKVSEGKDVEVIPDVPILPGYTGTWSNDGKNITADKVIYAIYTANEYTVTINKTNVTSSAVPEKLSADAEIVIEFQAENGYKLPTSVVVSGCTYNWNSKYGLLTLSKAISNINITITGDIAPQPVNAHSMILDTTESYVKIGDKPQVSFVEQDAITEVLPGEKILLHSGIPTCLMIKKININTLEETQIYETAEGENENEPTEEIIAEAGYKYYLEISFQHM